MSIGWTRIGGKIGVCVLALGLLGGCASWFNADRWGGNDPDAQRKAQDPYHYDPKWSNPDVFSDYRNSPDHQPKGVLDALFAPDTGNDNSGGGGGSPIGVNSFLWHASLDTVSFMPLASADPFGGTIITEWYSPPETPNERFKINLFIMSRDLRADGVRARVFRQNKDASGQWVDAAVDQTTGTGIENAILARARQIRMSTVAK